MRRICCYLFCLLLFSIPCFGQASDQPAPYSQSHWTQWKTKYDASLTARDGWLSLSGLYWLKPGINTLGSGEHNSLRLPDDAPIELATIKVTESELTLETDYQPLWVNGRLTKEAKLSVEENTRVNFLDYEFFLLKREIGYAVRLIKLNAEKARSFKGSRFFPFKENWIKEAQLVPNKKPTKTNVATVYGTTRIEDSAGWLHFKIDGKPYRLEAVDYGKDLPMYVFFSDDTAAETTYAAGRYLQVDWPDASGQVIMDFNRAYNPPCAYTEYATCPLTPPQNRLSIAIEAGELDYLTK